MAARSRTRLAPLAGALLGLLGTVSCSQTAAPCPPVGFPAQSSDRTPSAVDDEHETKASHVRLRRLISAVEALECGANGLDPQASSSALSKLADSLSLLAGVPTPAVLRVRSAAESLHSLSGGAGNVPSAESVPKTGKGQPIETVHAGLVAAQQVLLAQSGPVRSQSSVTALGDSVAAMQSERDLAARCQSAISAFRAASDAVFVGLDAGPPFGDTEPEASARRSFPSMAAGVEPARAAVASLGNAEWPRARDRAAEALRLFAAMLSAADCHGLFTSKISSLRFQSERLSRSDALGFGLSRWIKQGLSTALDVLDVLNTSQQAQSSAAATGKQAEPNRTAAAEPWARAARAAVANISSDELFGLQRTPIQDGFRATLDALVIAAASAPVCRA